MNRPLRARFAATAVVLLLLVVGCGGGNDGGRDGELSPLATDATVLAFGDSLTAGTGAKPGQAYPAVLTELSGLRVVNAGVPGETTPQGLERLPGQLEQHRPALVILCLGGNDMLRRLDLDAAKSNLAEMVRLARTAGAEVLLLAVPEPGFFLLSAAPFYAELAEELGVPMVEGALPEILAERDLKSDRIHPNAAGYRKLAEAIHERLKDAGAL